MSIKNHYPQRKLGQHFLHDAIVITHIINTLNLQKTDHVVEIGPGKGALTKPILSQVARLDAIEVDGLLAKQLPIQLGYPVHLMVHHLDALSADFSNFNAGDNRLRVVGNLPYNISTPLIFHLMRYKNHIHDMTVMLQKEVVDRICAPVHTKAYGRLSVLLQYCCEVEPLFTIAPTAFYPVPKITSSLLRLTPLKIPRYHLHDHHSFSIILRHAFAQRRKTIRNSLKAIMPQPYLAKTGLVLESRAQELSVKDFVNLANYYYQLNH